MVHIAGDLGAIAWSNDVDTAIAGKLDTSAADEAVAAIVGNPASDTSVALSSVFAPVAEPLAVKLTGAQTVAGLKDFTTAPTINGAAVALGADLTELAAIVAAIQAQLGAAPGGGGGTTMYNSAIYGSGVGFDCKGNVVVNAYESLAMRFKAGTTSTLTGIQWTQRTGPSGYSLGTGGTTTVSIQADDGTGKPSGTALASTTWAGGNPGAQEKYDICTFSSPPSLTAGTIYYAVFENPSAANYVSANQAYTYHAGQSDGVANAVRSINPKQPLFNDAEFGVLLTTSYGGTWSETVSNAQNYMPVVDLIYANAYHDGSAYYECMVGYWGTISGTASMVRESFTVSGGDRSVSHASVRVRRHSGTDNLVLTLETAAGAYIDSGIIPAANIQIPSDMALSTAGGGGCVWVTANFGAARTLTNGVAYNLRLSTAGGTTYSTAPIRNAAENYYGFHSRDFTDGIPYKTVNGSTWTVMAVSPYTDEHFDLQFYLS